MSEYVTACALDAIPDGQALAVQVEGLRLALVRQGSDVFAIADACSHADVALSEGEVSGCTLECWLHGSQFDLRTGAPLTPPAIKPVPVYPTRIRQDGSDAFVEIRMTPMSPDELAVVPNREKDQS
jgi:3-phenylpropionate/trans-cinnamate dioxygenase ferredoxin subunit